ncbi:MAG: hypothetical protein K1X64_06910 [Myxococcaceae bacterium]|nr:hypothetical protein [Myxococcaceae bacterium]
MPDAGTEAGFQVVPPALPAEPALPVFTPCPAGWRTVGTAPALCEPWPETGMAACTSDTAHFPGQPSCARVGTACPTGEWDDNFPTGKTVRFVRASAAPGGTGSRAAPFASLAEALTQAQPGDIVALGKGTYTTQTAVPREVTLWGACVAQTTVQRAAGSSVEGVVTSRSAGVAVKNLRITGPGVGLLALGRQAQLDAEDVVIEGASEVGWSSESGAQSTGRRVVIRHTTLGTAVAYEGAGIQVTLGSSLDASSVVLDGNRSSGLALDGAGTRVTLSDVAIVNTLPTPKDNTAGRGVLCQSGALLTLQRAVIEKNHHYGLRLVQAKAQLTDVLVRETTPRVSDNAVGAGLYALNGELTAQRTRSDGNQGVGIWLRDPDSRGVLKDVVMQENRGKRPPRQALG